jgi:Tfp pilus assembly protein PilN
MRELELLPDWYPLAQRQRHWLRLQVQILLLVVAALAVWLVLARQNIAEARDSLALLDGQLRQVRSELKLLDEQTVLLKRLQVQQEVESRLGLPVEMTRLVSSIDAAMPEEMALVRVEVSTDQTARSVAELAQSARKGRAQAEMPRDRHLVVRVVGVAPTDAEVTTFFSRLTENTAFQQVRMNYARDRQSVGLSMREVEIEFRVPLSHGAAS